MKEKAQNTHQIPRLTVSRRMGKMKPGNRETFAGFYGYGMSQAEDPNLQAEFRMLVSNCLAGQQPAIRELVRQFHGRVFGLCVRMLGHRQDAEDVTQETFVRVLKNLHRWDPNREFEPWLLTIASNRCRTMLAKRSVRPTPQSLEFPVSDRMHLEQGGSQLAEEVELAMSEMRDNHRQCFLLFHQQQMPYAEIAARVGVPLGTVKTWVHRARRDLIGKLRQRGVIANVGREMPTV